MTRTNHREPARVEIPLWHIEYLPGLIFIGLVMIARLTGLLQFLEWSAFDILLRLRSPETADRRVVIVGINENDIQKAGTYPISDEKLAQLIEILKQFEPRAIGLDIVRDLKVNPGHTELVNVYQNTPNLIGVEKALPPAIASPPELAANQIGFADYLADADGKIRRALLGMPIDGGSIKTTQKDYAYSFAIRLAETYLKTEDGGIQLSNGHHDPDAMRFGLTELPRFLPKFGKPIRNLVQQLFPAYGQENDDFGVQMLVNFRNCQDSPFEKLSLQDIEQGNFSASKLRDRIIIIGITAPSAKDLINSSAVANIDSPGSMYGVEFHAHVISQILSAVLDGRPLLKTWPEGWEYLWIIGWGIWGMSLSSLIRSPSKNLLAVIVSSITLLIICYLLLLWGYWIPLIPALLILVLNGVGLMSFYQHHRALQAVVDERQRTIEHTFTVIHNGPLQILANLLRQARDRNIPPEHLIEELETLNHEIRNVGEYLRQESLTQENTLRLANGSKLELELPIHELFYEVFSNTLKRNLPCFETLQVKVRSFEPIESQYLMPEQKRELCEYLEEVLCNVGKHAQGVTYLSATGIYNEGKYILTVKDNGLGRVSNYKGRGTKQCEEVAKHLKQGSFRSQRLTPRGLLCELSWNIGSRQR